MSKKNKNTNSGNKKLRPTRPSLSKTKVVTEKKEEMLYGAKHFKIILLGIGLIVLGFVLMSGGHMPSREVWDDNLIYGFRRTVLAPILILAGLGVQVYAIFKK